MGLSLDGGARVRKLGLAEKGGSVVVVAVAAFVLGGVGVVVVVVVIVEMSAGRGFAVEGTSVRKRVHVDVGSEVAGEPFLQDSRTRAEQSEREPVAGVPS